MTDSVSVETEDELIEIGLSMLGAETVVDAESPGMTRCVSWGPKIWGRWSTPGAPL